MRLALAAFGLLLIVLAAGFVERRSLTPHVARIFLPQPPPTAPPPLDPGVAWLGGWYTVEQLDPQTIAIGEPRAAGRNVSYLLLGSERAVLFDTGEGHADLRPIVDQLTSLPVTALPSHLHYDHMGSVRNFERLALPDLAPLRAQVEGGAFVPTDSQFLGMMVDVEPPELRPTQWWVPGASVDLGGRELILRHTPGHTPESVSLWDPERQWLFAGDYLSPGALYAFLPGSSIADYRATAHSLLGSLPSDSVFWGAHDEFSETLAPQLDMADLRDLRRVLQAIGAGEASATGFFPRVYAVNERIELWADIGDR